MLPIFLSKNISPSTKICTYLHSQEMKTKEPMTDKSTSKVLIPTVYFPLQ